MEWTRNPQTPGLAGPTIDPNAPALTPIDPEAAVRNPDAAQAAITRGMWESFKERYRPLEDEVIQTTLASVEPDAQAAGQRVLDSYANREQQFYTNLARSGQQLSGQDRKAVERRFALQRSLDHLTAVNGTRRGLNERNTNLMGDLVAMGRGVQGSAAQGLGSAANLQSSREAYNAQASAARQNQNLSLLGIAGGLATAFI